MADTMAGSVGLGLNLQGGFADQISAEANKAAKSMTSLMGKAASEVAADMSKNAASMRDQISAILSNTESSTQSQVMRIAALYRKAGKDQSEAMQMAWAHVEHGTDATVSLGDAAQKSGKKLNLFGKEAKKAGKETQKSTGAINQMTAGLKKIGVATVSTFAVKSIADFGKECMDLGSDLTEVQNVVNTAFSSMSDQIDSFAKGAATQFGLSETMAKRYSGTFGSMADAFGFTEAQAASMATTLTGLAGDTASFYNISQDEAYTKLKSVFTGETESLKDLGVVMTQTALDAYAMANGFGKTTAQMSEMEKVALRYSFVQNQLSNAAGDFAKTAGTSWANQVRIFTLQMDSLKATIGQGLINVFMPVIKLVNSLMGRLSALAESFKSFTEAIFGDAGGGEASGISNTLTEATGAADSLAASTSGVGEAAKKTVKDMQSLMGFDEINKISENDSGTDDGGSGSVGAVEFSSVSTGLSKGTNAVSGFTTKIQETMNTLKEAAAFVKDRFSAPVQKALKKICEPLTDMRNAAELAFADIQTLGAPLLEWLQGPLCDAIEIGLDTVSTIISGTLDSMGTVFETVWDTTIFPFASKFVTEWLPVITDAFSGVLGVVETAFSTLKGMFDTVWRDAIAPAVQLISGIVIGAIDSIVKAWNTYGTPLVEAIKEAVQTTGDLFQSLWDTVLAPVFDNIISVVGGLWEDHIKPVWDKLCTAIFEISTALLDFYNSTVAPLVEDIISWVGPKIVEIVNGLVETVGDFVGSLFDALGGLIDFVTGIFTGDWERAWNGIKSFLENIWTGIKNMFSKVASFFGGAFRGAWRAIKNAFSGVGTFFEDMWETIKGKFTDIGAKIGDSVSGAFKSCVNSVFALIEEKVNGFIGTINGAIGAINNIPGVNIGTISDVSLPRLAQGGYVKANTPQLAMIGDNKTQGEIVAPEGKLREMAAQAASGGNNEVIALLKLILAYLESRDIVELDPETIRKYMIKKTNQNTKATGRCELLV